MKNQYRPAIVGRLLALLLAVVLLLGMAPGVVAEEARRGSLSVRLTADIVDMLPDASEVQITLYQIGKAAPGSKSGWALDESMRGYGIIEAKTSAQLGEAAAKLARDIVKSDGYTGKALQMSKAGQVSFDGLEQGVYFGMMTAGPEGLEVEPFIATIPFLDPASGAPTYDYPVILKDECVTSATVKKVWQDNDNQDGKRPAQIEVALSNGKKVTLNDANGWTATLEGLPIYEKGRKVEYTWSEPVVDGYKGAASVSADGLVTTFTNTHTPEEVSVHVAKVWNDDNNRDGLRPESLKVTLSNGAEVILNDANGWKADIEHLPKYQGGKEIAYTWSEQAVTGYTAAAAVTGTTTTLTNSHNPEETYALVRKVWDDSDNIDGIRPKAVRVTLSNGTEVELNEGNSWAARVDHLPKYEAGREIEYTWVEADVTGYVATYQKVGEVTTITNTHTTTVTPSPTPVPTPTPTPVPTPTPTPTPSPTPTTPPTVVTAPPRGNPTPTPVPTTEITGTKVWVDEDNVHKTRPGSITVTLLANGSPVDAAPTWSGTNTNRWTYTFRGLPAVTESGATINYSVRETPVAGYESKVSGLTITNTLIPKEPKEYKELAGKKTWRESQVSAATAAAKPARPNVITVRLLRDGVEIASRSVTAVNDWSYTFGKQPVDDGYGNTYTYEIREDAVQGYFCRVNGMDLVNTALPTGTPPTPGTPGRVTVPNYTPMGRLVIPSRKTGTPPPKFEIESEEELEELLDLFGYGTPLFGGLLGTGDETPVYPYVFGGVGALAVIALVVLGLKRKKKER